MHQVHGADVGAGRRPGRRATRPPATPSYTSRPGRRAAGARRRLRAGAARRPGGRVDRGGARRSPRAGRGRRPGGRRGAARARRGSDGRVDRPARLRCLLRGARRAAGRGGRGRAGVALHHLVGHARPRPRCGRARPARTRPASTTSGSSTSCTREDPSWPSYRRDGAAATRFAGVIWIHAMSDAAAATSSPPTSTPYAAASPPRARRPVARRTMSRSSWSPSSSPPPTCGCSPTSASPTWGRTATRRPRPRPPSAPTSGCAGTSSGVCSPTRPRPWRPTPTSSSRSTAPSWSARCRAGRTRAARDQDVDVLLQVSLDPPGADHRSGADPADLDALAARVEDAGMLRLRGLMAVAPLGEEPGDGLRAARGDPRRLPARAPGRHRAVGGDERRPRGGDRVRCDTRACRLRGPRSEARGPVMSTTVIRCPDRGARSSGGSVS